MACQVMLAPGTLEGVSPIMRALAASVVRGLLPYPDLVRRWRVRKAARRLATREPWPTDDATTATDVARLALLRLLWLQKQTRRAVRGRHREAAALLGRSSLEACILALYCLHSPDVVARLKTEHLRASSKLLAFLDRAEVVPHEVIKEALSALGSPATGVPTIPQMAERIDTETSGSAVSELYERLYVPASTYFVHPNPASLLRHVNPDQTLTERPSDPWTRRSPVRLADACVGLVAGAIAHTDGVPNELFVAYAEAHHARTMTPMVVMTAKGLTRSRRMSQLLDAVRDALDLRRYLAGPANNDPREVREARVRAMYAKVVDPDLPPDALKPVYDYLVNRLIDDWADDKASSADVA
ncbi:DUF5677 domain-containing protein [Micromonospora sp. NPDC023966]|uniref:DUF5677 domain-containing protein n=1 Tax=Micromonospora sp. NPDC023966 TaxID=3154699 RepID=UPI0033D6F887